VTNHGGRYTAATRLHELDCDWETIAAITGHETAAMVRKYTEKRRKARLAIARINRASARMKSEKGT
jgi:integrase